MCGIAAIFAYRSTAPAVDRDEIERITERMRPRGPDSGGTWIADDGRVALGARRLAIIDLSPEGNQPLFDVERDLAIVFNGEIYNYRELRASLVRGGARFHSATDTEVLLHLYRRDGARMLGLLRGMFAFAIWETRARRMFAARDPYGIKPLYFADDGQTVRIASEVKALLAGGAVSRTRDPAGTAGFFLTGSVPEPFTIVESVRALEAGDAFFVDADRGRTPAPRSDSITRVFRRAEALRPTVGLTEPDIAFRERIEESVEYHLVADVPVGVLLSSGIDSSALTAIGSRLSGEPLRTFTVAFEEFRGRAENEAPLAERFAAELGTIHTTRVVSRDEFRSDLPRIFELMDQPTIDGINTWFASKAVREAGVKVALSGIGGDELFGGYPSFRTIPRILRIAKTPVAIALRSLARHPKKRLVREYGSTYGGAYLLQRGLFLPHELHELLGSEAEDALERLRIVDIFSSSLDPDPGSDFARVATLEAAHYMRNQLLRDTDWASMSHSVEIRMPLVDMALLRQVGPLVLDHGGDRKAVLGSILPPWLRNRRKTGFVTPVAEWMDLPPDGTTTRMRSWARFVFEAVSI